MLSSFFEKEGRKKNSERENFLPSYFFGWCLICNNSMETKRTEQQKKLKDKYFNREVSLQIHKYL